MGHHWALAACCALALTGCPTVDLGDTPPDIGLCNPNGGLPYFQDQIWPMFLASSNDAKNCTKAGCHNGMHGLTLDTSDPIDFQTNYRLAQGYLNCGQPSASLLLTKPLAGVEPHGGGDLFPDMNDTAVQVFLGWFQ